MNKQHNVSEHCVIRVGRLVRCSSYEALIEGRVDRKITTTLWVSEASDEDMYVHGCDVLASD